MSAMLLTYRDDGRLAELAAGERRLALSPLVLAGLGLLALIGGLAIDGADMTAWSLAGAVVFVALGIASRAAKPDSRVGWLVPPLLRAGEYGLVVWLAWRSPGTEMPVAYLLLAALAFHHYDVVYRTRQLGTPPPPRLGRLGGGWEVRVLLLVIAALAGVLLPVMAAMAAWCAVLYVRESVTSWISVARDEQRTILAGDDEEDED